MFSPHRYYAPKEIAAILSVHPSKVRSWISAGLMCAYSLPADEATQQREHVRVRGDDVLVSLKRVQAKPGPRTKTPKAI